MISRPGHEETVRWIKERLEALNNYYDVSLQPVWAIVQFTEAVNAFLIDGSEIPKSSYSLFEFSPSGKVTAPLMIVDGGCNKVSFLIYSVMSDLLLNCSNVD